MNNNAGFGERITFYNGSHEIAGQKEMELGIRKHTHTMPGVYLE